MYVACRSLLGSGLLLALGPSAAASMSSKRKGQGGSHVPSPSPGSLLPASAAAGGAAAGAAAAGAEGGSAEGGRGAGKLKHALSAGPGSGPSALPPASKKQENQRVVEVGGERVVLQGVPLEQNQGEGLQELTQLLISRENSKLGGSRPGSRPSPRPSPSPRQYLSRLVGVSAADRAAATRQAQERAAALMQVGTHA